MRRRPPAIDAEAAERMTYVTGRTDREDVKESEVSDAGGGPEDRARPWARHRAPIKPGRQVVKAVAGSVAALLVLLVVGGIAEYAHLDGNLHSVPLFGGILGNAGTEKADAFGHTPINMLVIGSDTRSDAADCAIGHDCGPGANADVELIVHVSADRSNATVMSIPRDTMTQLPGCRDPRTGTLMPGHFGQINATLDYGPGCTVAAVHQLTGIPIDHFAMLDFVGVVQMSDAVGGVPICVSDDVYDPYSHLRLTRGKHVLKGLAALEFVRSRHAFGDGGDLGRTYAQHLFLSSMIRTLKGTGVITDPGALLSLADAATKALTVDTGLGSVSSLISLAADVNKVPSSRITFTTMPSGPDPSDPNRIVPATGAATLFAAIADDRSLSAARSGGSSPSPSAAAASSPSVAASSSSSAAPGASGTAGGDLSGATVQVENGSGITGRARTVEQFLLAHGAGPSSSYGTTGSTARSAVQFDAAHAAAAENVAALLGLPSSTLVASTDPGITVVIGTDWTSGTTYPAVDAAAVASALPSAHARTADDASSCAQVSTQRTVAVNGVSMTPAQAFADTPTVPLSAP